MLARSPPRPLPTDDSIAANVFDKIVPDDYVQAREPPGSSKLRALRDDRGTVNLPNDILLDDQVIKWTGAFCHHSAKENSTGLFSLIGPITSWMYKSDMRR